MIQFPVFIQPYTQKPLILYQLETVPVPILDRNNKAHPYMHLHKTSYSCESAIYFNLTTDIIKNICNFDFYFNKTDITPTVLFGGNKIVLTNWPNVKHIICNVNNDIPVKISSHPYVLINRSVLCNCEIEADNHYLLESIATCDNKDSNLVMYFTINMAFTNYLDMFPILPTHH